VDRFIIGTGRCGSTLLSRMMAENPRALSVFEYFNGLDFARRFAPGPVEGAAFARLISAEQPFLTAVVRRGYLVEEVLYRYADDPSEAQGRRGRYRRDEGLPWILVGLLPRLTDQPDALFDEVMDFAQGLPSQPMRLHHRALFDWLVKRFGRDYWIERSGSSIDYLEALAQEFPEARFVHIHRDGCEVALSIREHHAFRLPATLLCDMPTETGRASEIGPLDLHAPPTGDDRLSRIIASRPPAHYFGRFWSDQVIRGFRALRRLDRDRYLEVRFEDLVTGRRGVLDGIADFLELGEERAWIGRAAALIRGVPPRRFDALPPHEQEALREACRPGLALLGREV
jgi:hypothetical protein